MKWPLVSRRRYEIVVCDNDRLRIENSIARRIRVDLEGSNNALRQMVKELQKELKEKDASSSG